MDIINYLLNAIALVYRDFSSLMANNASAFFGLLGAMIGGASSYLAAKRLKTHEFKLQIKNKMLDRQILANENVLKIALQMRVMTGSGKVDKNNQVIRFPEILESKKRFEDWFTDFTKMQLESTSWLSISVKRELNFVQDYLITLYTNLKDVPSELYSEAGGLIYEDFSDLSNSLEKKVHEFFNTDLSEVKLADLNLWHKYEKNFTEKRLLNMKLLKNIEIIKDFLDLKREKA